MLPLREFISLYSNYFANKATKNILNITDNKERYLFEQLAQGAEPYSISRALYNDTPSNRSFKMLKANLFDKLLSSTLVIDSGNHIQRTKRMINKRVFAAKTLENFGFKSVYVPICSRLLPKALEYHMYAEAAELARILFKYHAVFGSGVRVAQQYYDTAIQSAAIYNEEIKMEWQYSVMRSNLHKMLTNGDTSLLQSLAIELHAKKGNGSLRINFMYYETQFFAAYAAHDETRKIEVCNGAIEYFNNLPFDHSLAKDIFIIHLIDTYIDMHNLAKAELLLLNEIESRSHKDKNLYRFNDLLLKIYLFKGDIAKSQKAYDYLYSNKLSTVYDKDRFLVYSIYIGLLTNQSVNFRKIYYNLNKVKQDKKGLYASLLVGQAVYHYIHDRDKFIDKLDGLKQYCYKYLQEDNHKRTFEFVKLLSLLIDNKDVVPELSHDKESLTGQSLEIIDYDILLKIIEEKKYISKVLKT